MKFFGKVEIKFSLTEKRDERSVYEGIDGVHSRDFVDEVSACSGIKKGEIERPIISITIY